MGLGLPRTSSSNELVRPALLDRERQILMVADARLENRSELISSIGATNNEILDDAALLFRGFQIHGMKILELISGDFSFAVWDQRSMTLMLARDPFGQRPLHFHHNKEFLAFSSMPGGLIGLDGISGVPDQEALAGFVSDIPRHGTRSYFQDIHRVEPGTVVSIRPEGIRCTRYWERPTTTIFFQRSSEYSDALLDHLDKAVASRLAGAAVASHLSAGLDSSAVTASAALSLARSNKQLIAMTAAPRRGFSGPAPGGRIVDESGVAGITAAFLPNVRHEIVRSGSVSPLDYLAEGFQVYQEPIGHLCNHVWWSAVNARAEELGAGVMLTGEAGNLALSFGGPAFLADLVRAGQWREWWRSSRASLAQGAMHWKSILASSFGPWIPDPLWRLAGRLTSSNSGYSDGAELLHPDIRQGWLLQARLAARERKPEKDSRQVLWSLLTGQDAGVYRQAARLRWGVDERDATSDRRLAEFCFSLPLDQIYADGQARRLARAALAHRLPAEVLQGARGYQYADWYENITRDRLLEELAVFESSGAANALLDLRRIRALIDKWPPGEWGSLSTIRTFRVSLLRALSAGRFAADASG